MRVTKKIAAVFFALMLAVSVSLPAFAYAGTGSGAGTNTDPHVGSVDFGDTDNGIITLFKLDIAAFEKLKSVGGDTAVFVGNAPTGASLASSDVVGQYYMTSDPSTKFNVTVSELAALSDITFQIEAVIFNNAKGNDDHTDPQNYAIDTVVDINSYAKTDSTGHIIWEGLPNGIYRVTELANSTGSAVDKSQFVISLPMVDPQDPTGTTTTNNVYVYPKNRLVEGPVVEKEIDDSAADHNGNVISYKLTAELPQNLKAIQGAQVYKITDTIGTGLDYKQSSVRVYYEDALNAPVYLVKDTDYSVTFTPASDPNIMVITLLSSGYTKLESVVANAALADTLYVTYNAVVNMTDAEFAQIGVNKDPVSNKAQLDFTNDDGYAYTPDTDVVVADGVAAIKVIKYDGATDAPAVGSNTTYLPGAKFKVYTALNTLATDVDTATVLKDAGGNEVVLTTAANGTITYNGLLEGTYYLVETQVPTGYKALNGYATVVISTADVTANKTVSTSVANYLDNGLTLPATGSAGTVIFVVVGAALVLLAGVVLVASKKRGNKSDK